MGKKQTAPNPDHEQQPLDETVAKGEHMDLDLNDEALEAERRAGAPMPTGVILGSSSSAGQPNVSEEMQGMEMIPKTFGPPQYGSPDPATAASRLMTLEDGHPLEGLPEDHPSALSEDYGVIYEEPSAGQTEQSRLTAMPRSTATPGVEGEERDLGNEVDATDGARKAAEDKGIDLSQVQGSGKGGKVTKEDVENFAEGGGQGDPHFPDRQDVDEVNS